MTEALTTELARLHALRVISNALVRRARVAAGDPRPIRSLAVLPLADYSEHPEEFFAAGMTEALTTELARLHGLRVVSNSSARRFAGSTRALSEIARQLQVDALLEGSIVRAGDTVRLTAQLIDGRTDSHLWADQFESRRGDVLRLQAELALAVARAIELELPPAQSGRLADAPTIDPEAHDAYLRGRYFWNQRTPAGLQKALAELERATRLEPGWAPAWAGLADAWSLLAISGYDLAPPGDAMPRARGGRRPRARARPDPRRGENLDRLDRLHLRVGFRPRRAGVSRGDRAQPLLPDRPPVVLESPLRARAHRRGGARDSSRAGARSALARRQQRSGLALLLLGAARSRHRAL